MTPPPTGGDHADFDSECAGKILFESEGLSGYSAEGFKAWQRAAAAPQSGTGTTGAICLNDQGGNRMDVTEKVTCTLRAEAHHPPCVMESAAGASCAGFCTEHSAKARGIGYEDETSPTLRAGTVPATVYENHSQDTRYTELHGIARFLQPMELAATTSRLSWKILAVLMFVSHLTVRKTRAITAMKQIHHVR